MAMLLRISTNIVARPICKPFRADVVVASVGHMPSSSTNVGFSLRSPFVMIDKLLFAMSTCAVRI